MHTQNRTAKQIRKKGRCSERIGCKAKEEKGRGAHSVAEKPFEQTIIAILVIIRCERGLTVDSFAVYRQHEARTRKRLFLIRNPFSHFPLNS